MKKYTKADVDALKRGSDGWLHFPTGDYTGVENFPDSCRFDNCEFEEM
jgi:hypothetical protein